MKRLLLVSYYFPPVGGAGITRARNLMRLLPANGWDCHILTVKSIAYRTFEPELLDGLDQGRIHRSGSFDPQRLLRLLGVETVSAAFVEQGKGISGQFFPDPKVGWAKPACRKGIELHSTYHFDAIMTTSPPISAHLVGLSLSKRLRIPWVADFRDPWTTRTIEQEFRSPGLQKRAHGLLDTIIANSDAQIAVTDGIRKYLGATDMIHNAFDSTFAARWTASPDPSMFRIGISGTTTAEQVAPLARLIDSMISADQSLAGRISIELVGSCEEPKMQHLIDSYQGIIWNRHGRCRRDETISLLSRCGLLYLGVTEGQGPMVLTSRIFDLLPSGRPIVVFASRDSDLCRFASQIPAAHWFDWSSNASAAALIGDTFNRHQSGAMQLNPLPDWSMQYADSELARRVAAVLDRVTSAGASTGSPSTHRS